MLWIMMALVAVLGGVLIARRRRAYGSVEEEPWRASLGEEEPLDLEEIRRAEEDWLREAGAEGSDDEETWR